MLIAIVSSVLGAAIASVGGPILWFLWFYFSRYRRLLRFFGIDPSCPRIILYISSLNVLRGGAVDASGQPRSYQGVALPGNEFQSIQSFARTFGEIQTKPLYSVLRLLTRQHWSLNVEPRVAPSPLQSRDIDFANILTLGTPGYNEVTKYYQQRGAPWLRWDLANQQIQVCRGPQSGQNIPNPYNQDLAILEKLIDDTHQTTVFVAAGLDVNGTRGAAEYLVANWRRLSTSYDDRAFAWCLSFPPAGQDPNGWRHATVLQRFPD